jgi:hypothetical protein
LISYLSGANNYTWVHFRTDSKVLISKPLRYFEERLPGFIRIHKIVLANPQCIKTLLPPPKPKQGGAVQLEDGTSLPISRRRWKEVADDFNHKMDTGAATIPTDITAAPMVIFVTNDKAKGLLLQQVIESQYPPYRVHLMAKGVHLPNLLRMTPPSELPTLVMLDARTCIDEQLTTLNLLKSKQHTLLLPTVVLLKTEEQPSVYQEYAQHANSVLFISDNNTQFVQTIEQVGEYWLRFTALPTRS